MSAGSHVVWREDGWDGWIDPTCRIAPVSCLAAAGEGARASRHARTTRFATADEVVFVKRYPSPGGWRAARAFRMGEALRAAGFGAPEVVLAGQRSREGVLVTRDTGGEDVARALTRRAPDVAAKRALLRQLGDQVGRLHRAGFVHGDLVPPNVQVVGGRIVFLDNDRTRRSRLLVRLTARRNLVQLGRFVVPGVTLTDRARVLAAYAHARGLDRRARRRLASWVVQKTVARRCSVDHIPEATAERAGFRALMRSGGPFDPPARTA